MKKFIISLPLLLITSLWIGNDSLYAQYKIEGSFSRIGRGTESNTNIHITSRVGQPLMGNAGNASASVRSGFRNLELAVTELSVMEFTELDKTDSLLQAKVVNKQNMRMRLIPTEFALLQNYPNPFNPSATIRYDLPKATHVVLKIYNILGQEVHTLVNERQTAGEKSVVWNGQDHLGKDVSSGIYIYQIRTGDYLNSREMVLLR